MTALDGGGDRDCYGFIGVQFEYAIRCLRCYRLVWGIRLGCCALSRLRRRFLRRVEAVPFLSEGLLVMMDDMGLSFRAALRGDGGALLYLPSLAYR